MLPTRAREDAHPESGMDKRGGIPGLEGRRKNGTCANRPHSGRKDRNGAAMPGSPDGLAGWNQVIGFTGVRGSAL